MAGALATDQLNGPAPSQQGGLLVLSLQHPNPRMVAEKLSENILAVMCGQKDRQYERAGATYLQKRPHPSKALGGSALPPRGHLNMPQQGHGASPVSLSPSPHGHPTASGSYSASPASSTGAQSSENPGKIEVLSFGSSDPSAASISCVAAIGAVMARFDGHFPALLSRLGYEATRIFSISGQWFSIGDFRVALGMVKQSSVLVSDRLIVEVDYPPAHNLALHRVSSSSIAFSPLLPPPSSVQSQSASAGGAGAGGSSNSQTLLFEFLQLLFDRVATLHVSPPDTSKQPDDGLLSIHLQSPAFPIALSDRHSIQHTAFQFLAIFNEIASQSHKSQPQPPYHASAKHSPSASSPSSTSSPSATAASVSAAMARAARPPAGGRSTPPARNSPQLPGAPPGLPHTDARHMQQAAGFSTIPTPPSQPSSASANSSSGSSRGTSSSRSNPKPSSKERSSRGTKKKDRSKKKSSKQR